jgi:hypothetical protein
LGRVKKYHPDLKDSRPRAVSWDSLISHSGSVAANILGTTQAKKFCIFEVAGKNIVLLKLHNSAIYLLKKGSDLKMSPPLLSAEIRGPRVFLFPPNFPVVFVVHTLLYLLR